ncbi:hypothetical protein RB594_006902 [Gaeumannomyces avenae]
MPTLHVTPDGHDSLQAIADALCKARKVVVITGAGISTNSGIPDFRSGNGLYSLIQAQFDHASSASASQPTTAAGFIDAAPTTAPPLSADATLGREDDLDRDRATKRRKLSPEPTNHRDEPSTELQEDTQPRESHETELSNPTSPMPVLNEPTEELPSQSVEAPPPQQPPIFPSIYDLRARQATSPLSSPPPGLFDPLGRQSMSPTVSTRSSEPTEGDETPPSSAPMSQSASSHNMQNLPNMKGKDLFDVSIWRDPTRTSVFYTFTTSLRRKVKSAEPTNTHHFLGHLRDRGKLVRCYTQNIDEIEEKVGLTTCLKLGPGHRGRFSTRAHRASAPAALNRAMSDPGALEAPREKRSSGVECVYLHGSLSSLRCFACGRISDWEDERESETMSGKQPACPHCAGATAAREGRGKRALGVGKLRPNIVLYGEEHPNAHLIAPVVQHDLSLNPEMLLILGTSLRVHGLKVMVREFAKAIHSRNGTVVFVNLTKPAESTWADIIDYWVQWDCDAWVNDLKAKKPVMWLPPGAELPEPEKQRKESKPKATKATIASKIKQPKTLGSRKSKGSLSPPSVEGSGTIAAEQDTSLEVQNTTDAVDLQEAVNPQEAVDPREVVSGGGQEVKMPGRSDQPRQPKEPKPPPVRFPQLPDDKTNTAVLVATLQAHLAKIGRRRNDYHASMQHPLNPRDIRRLTSRNSALAGDMAVSGTSGSVPDGHSWTATPTPSHRVKKPATKRKSQVKLELPSPFATPRAQMEHPDNPSLISIIPSVKSEGAQPPAVPTAILSDEAGDSRDSIAAAIKSNPRKRKPKMIDGCEIIVPGARRSMAPVQPPTPSAVQPSPSNKPGTCATEPVISGIPETGGSGASTMPDLNHASPTAGPGPHDKTQRAYQVPAFIVASAGQATAWGPSVIPPDAHSDLPPPPRNPFSANPISASDQVPTLRPSSASSAVTPALCIPSRLVPRDGSQEACHNRAQPRRKSLAAQCGSARPPSWSEAHMPRFVADHSQTPPGWLIGQYSRDKQKWKAPVTYTPLSFPPTPMSSQRNQAFQLTQPLLHVYGSEPRFALVCEPPPSPSFVSEQDRTAEAALALTSMKAVRP